MTILNFIKIIYTLSKEFFFVTDANVLYPKKSARLETILDLSGNWELNKFIKFMISSSYLISNFWLKKLANSLVPDILKLVDL